MFIRMKTLNTSLGARASNAHNVMSRAVHCMLYKVLTELRNNMSKTLFISFVNTYIARIDIFIETSFYMVVIKLSRYATEF